MTSLNFADCYAAAGLAPTAQIVTARETPATRIIDTATKAQIIDLVGVYYGSPALILTWLRNEFAKEDASFSLVNNEREVRVLASAILASLVAQGRSEAILSVVSGHVAGHRLPSEAAWLVADAIAALNARSVLERKPATFETKVVPTVATTLKDEIAALVQNDLATLQALLGKIRAESQQSAKATANQTTTALDELNRQVSLQREESQMLWWLTGGYSRNLQRSFSEFGPAQAALVGAVDLASLTTVTRLGPIAAPAMLERVIAMSKRTRGQVGQNLASAVDGLAPADTERLPIRPDLVPARLAPVTQALALARTIGVGAWHTRFRETTGLESTMALEPVVLATQLYREHLLGQLL